MTGTTFAGGAGTAFLRDHLHDRPDDARRLGWVALAIIGATSGLQLANYTLTGLSILCLLLAPAYFFMEHRGAELLPLALALLGSVSFVASCVINHVSLLWPNALASTAFALYFLGLTVLAEGSIDRIAMLLTGIGVGTVLFFAGKGIELTHTGNLLDVWKYGIAHSITIVFVVVMTLSRAPVLLQSAALAALGLGSLGLNYRSHALVCLVAAAILFTQRVFGQRIGRGWQFIGIVGFGLAFSVILPVLGRSGLFGQALQEKTLEQEATNTTDLPLLLAGRTEPPMSITAIVERPFLGWGSAVNLTPDVYTRAEHLAVRIGYAPTFPFDGYWRLPADDYSAMHSILLGSWAEGGLLSALLPAWLIVACVAIIWNNYRFDRWASLALIVGLQGIWDILYAPWTYNMVPECACIALLFGATHFRARYLDPWPRR